MSAESYTRGQLEHALIEDGYIVLQEDAGLVIYQTNIYPGNDLVIDWSMGKYDWEDLRAQLEFHGMNPEPIRNRLCRGRKPKPSPKSS